jgi:hypothetical protein
LPHRAIVLARHSLLAATVAAATACADSFPPNTVANAGQMFEAGAARFAPNVLDPRYATARERIAQSALVPSRIVDDTSIWTSRPSASTVLLSVSGTLAADGRYHFDTRPTPAPLLRLGDARHTIALERRSDNQFRWNTRADLAMGPITADEFAQVIETLLRTPEGRTERSLRDDYRAAFPRAMAAFGRGFVLDSVAVAPVSMGATGVTLRFAFKPELMKPAFPALAQYVDKYLGPAKYHFVITDRGGAALFDVAGRDRAVTLRYRVAQGKLVSLLGPPRAWPDSLTLLSDVSLKVKIFTVGVHELNTDFVISNTTSGNAHERAVTIVAQREPKWDLPLITERLIRSPLRHPFEGQGSMFRLSVRDSAGSQSILSRRTRLEVQESAIMRFIGSLASRALGDLDQKVEQEEHRFLREAFIALEADLRRR